MLESGRVGERGRLNDVVSAEKSVSVAKSCVTTEGPRAMGAESAGAREKGAWLQQPVQPSLGFAKLLAARSALCQSLEKSRALGTLLDQSDKRLQTVQERLSPVRRALAPLEVQVKVAEGLTERIDQKLEPAMSVLSMFDVVSKIRVRLVRDPRDDFDGYMAAVLQLEDAVDYLKQNSIVAIQWLQEAVTFLSEAGSTDTVRIKRLNASLETLKSQQAGGAVSLDGGLLVAALSKLEKEFKRLLEKNSRPIDLPHQMEPQEGESNSEEELDYLVTFPQEVQERLQAIIGKLVGNPNYQRCIDAYQECRGALCEESLQILDVSYLDGITPKSVSEIPWDNLQNMIHIWTHHLEVTVKVLYAGERRLARQVFKYLGDLVWMECLRNLAEPEMNAFIQFGESVAASQRSPEKLCKLLEMFVCLETCEPSVTRVFEGQACAEIRSRYRELLKQVVYASGKTFWDIDDWVRGQREGASQDGKVMQLCSWVVNYLKYVLALFPEALSKVLRIAGSWEAGSGEEKGLDQGIKQILQTLEDLVEGRAKELQDPALRHIFLMNNMYYIRNRVKNSNLGPLLGEDLMSEVGRKVSQNALKYQREGWQSVLQHLNREGLQGSSSGKYSRDLVRQRLRAFNAAFDATIETHSKWIIPEQNLRDGTIAAITQMVVPAYRSFLGTFGPLLEGRMRDTDKYLKYSPEIMETILGDLFTGSG